MKHPFCILLTAILCATASAQTIRTLGYNLTNGQVVAATNIVWTNSFNFSTNTVAAQVRTNLSLGWAALTNTNAATSLLGFTTNGEVVANTGTNVMTFTNNLQIGTDLLIQANFNTIRFETNSFYINFEDGSLGEGLLNFPTIYWRSNYVEFQAPIQFDNTTNAATTRTNLGLPLAALTNANNANFISALGVLATNGNAAALTNFPTVATASNITGVVALINGGTGATNDQIARTNLFGHGGISTNVSVVGTNNTNTLVFTNGLLMEVQ